MSLPLPLSLSLSLSLSSLPTDLITLTANSFLHDRSTFTLGQCSKRLFSDLRSQYLIKTQVRCLIGVESVMQMQLQSMKPQERMLVLDTDTTAAALTESAPIIDEPIIQPRKKQKTRGKSPATVSRTVVQQPTTTTILRLKWYKQGKEEEAESYAIGVRSNFYIENNPPWSPGLDLTHNDIEWSSFLPSHIRELEFGHGFTHDRLPSLAHFTRLHTIKFVQFAKCNEPTRTNQSIWPESLRTLEYGNAYSGFGSGGAKRSLKPSEVVFPSSLTCLILPQSGGALGSDPFPDPSKFTFPLTLKSLVLPSIKKAIVNWSPPSQLESLTCQVDHAQDLAKVKWPLRLLSLEISLSSGYFDPPMKSLKTVALPQSLHTLILLHYGHENEESLNDVIFPASLKKLLLGPSYPHSISHMKLPYSLMHLETSVTSLRPYSSSLILFSQLKYLTINGQMVQDPELSSRLRLPDTLEILEFGMELNDQPLAGIQLPKRLRALLIHSIVFTHSLSSVVIPSSLRRLEIGWRGNSDGASRFNRPLDLSTTLVEILDLGDGWNLPLSQLQLPVTLRELHFGREFNQLFTDFQLPPHLEVLTIISAAPGSPMFRQVESLMQLALPASIRKLVLPYPDLISVPHEASELVKAAYSAFIASLKAGPIMVHLA